MWIYILFIIIIILTVYFTTKEGLDEVEYKDPIQIMNTMNTILDDGQTETQQVKIHVQKQTNEIQPHFDSEVQENGKLNGDLKKCQQTSNKIKNDILNINDRKMNYILHKIGKNDLNSLAQYIQELDDTYTLLEFVNAEFIKRANNYRNAFGWWGFFFQWNIQKIEPAALPPLNDIIKRYNQIGIKETRSINLEQWKRMVNF